MAGKALEDAVNARLAANWTATAIVLDDTADSGPVDGSAYVTHVELVRKARGAEMPPSFWSDPLMFPVEPASGALSDHAVPAVA